MIFKYSTGSVTNATVLHHVKNGCNKPGLLLKAIGIEESDLDILSKLHNMKQKKKYLINNGNIRLSNWQITEIGETHLSQYSHEVQTGKIKFLPFRVQTNNNINQNKKLEPEPNLSEKALNVLDLIAPILEVDTQLNDLISSIQILLSNSLLSETVKVPKLEAGLMQSISEIQVQNAIRINNLVELKNTIKEY